MTANYPLRPEVLAFEPYSAGLSIEEIRKRYGLHSIIKMASNECPLGTSPLVQQAIRDAAPYGFRYIQSGNPDLVRAIAKRHRISPERVVPGNGSDEIIDLLVRIVPSPGKHTVVINKPAFSMYKICCRLCGVEYLEVPLRPDFSFDWHGLRSAVDQRTALVFLTTPDNPSGYCPPVGEVREFARSLPPTCLLVIDEAYMDFADNPAEASLLSEPDTFPNLVFLRTFSKSYGLAGIRLGYGILPEALADAMRRVHPPFSVNLLAEAAGLAALDDTIFYEKVLDTVRTGRAYLENELKALGCRVLPSQANFLFIRPPEEKKVTAIQVYEELLKRGIIVRSLKSYGIPDALRVSVGSWEENAVFIARLKEVLQ